MGRWGGGVACSTFFSFFMGVVCLFLSFVVSTCYIGLMLISIVFESFGIQVCLSACHSWVLLHDASTVFCRVLAAYFLVLVST